MTTTTILRMQQRVNKLLKNWFQNIKKTTKAAKL